MSAHTTVLPGGKPFRGWCSTHTFEDSVREWFLVAVCEGWTRRQLAAKINPLLPNFSDCEDTDSVKHARGYVKGVLDAYELMREVKA